MKNSNGANEPLKQALFERAACIAALDTVAIAEAVDTLADCIHKKGSIFAVGNGGSAAEAEHFIAELVGRFDGYRFGLRAFSLNSNVAVVTALANDFDYERAFSLQIEAAALPGDVLCLFTTSGRSPSIVAAHRAATERGLRILSFVGESDVLWKQATLETALQAPTQSIQIAQECHLAYVHMICAGLKERISTWQ